ncbi:SIS domain-containing protein [Azohydromonas sp.]|uniref:SIS domain-containing protein n=1 Tax=Azohydromonas sp. TaxID=1872666 RepID=UPI002CB8069F|nr:SIS domain-containing protein [Azohydromonas sp.]HMM84667.1 SIS domain-containing protein [Azohydromonas sp.]
MVEQRIQQHFFDAADLLYQSAEALSRPVADAAQALLGGITGGGKLLLAGSGPSQAVAQAMAAQLVERFERERPSLAALALGTDASLNASALPAARRLALQVQALGAPGDVLVLFGAGEDAASLAEVAAAAQGKDMTVVAFAGPDSPLIAALGETDVLVSVPHERAARVLEVHLLVAHALCDVLDLQLMGEQDRA